MREKERVLGEGERIDISMCIVQLCAELMNASELLYSMLDAGSECLS